jgi:hypothetical protein
VQVEHYFGIRNRLGHDTMDLTLPRFVITTHAIKSYQSNLGNVTINEERTTTMKVKAWRNGPFSKASVMYGIRIGAENRNRHFRRDWRFVTIQTDDGLAVDVPVTEAFWRDCAEVRHRFFRNWFTQQNLLPWPSRHPPQFDLRSIAGNRFALKRE